MSFSPCLPTAFIVAAAVLGGCAAPNSATTSSSTAAAPGPGASSGTTSTTPNAAPTKATTAAGAPASDPRHLLLTAEDVTDSDDKFTQRAQDPQPNGGQGASAFFVNEKDTRAISDTFTIYPDPAAAAAALKQATATLPTLVANGTPAPAPVGTDGVLIRGRHPQEAKDVTVLFFAEGRSLARLEFQSATGDPATDRFVTSVGKMQQIALRVGLADGP